ncbi:valacyclovir hydrolase [Platysternon megacephalum]|uniref:Valacyclovir hydrolase n=1 Tax=Platysternon megacephalum TaxID=55544 RepID=A0A4D9ER08_9SAUR|nr:valacyclovir hydrolase [Platysternon megacephalum]
MGRVTLLECKSPAPGSSPLPMAGLRAAPCTALARRPGRSRSAQACSERLPGCRLPLPRCPGELSQTWRLPAQLGSAGKLQGPCPAARFASSSRGRLGAFPIPDLPGPAPLRSGALPQSRALVPELQGPAQRPQKPEG